MPLLHTRIYASLLKLFWGGVRVQEFMSSIRKWQRKDLRCPVIARRQSAKGVRSKSKHEQPARSADRSSKSAKKENTESLLLQRVVPCGMRQKPLRYQRGAQRFSDDSADCAACAEAGRIRLATHQVRSNFTATSASSSRSRNSAKSRLQSANMADYRKCCSRFHGARYKPDLVGG